MQRLSPTFTEALSEATRRGLLSLGTSRRVVLAARLGAASGLISGPASETGLESASGPGPLVSGKVLASDLGLSRTAVHKHVEYLRALGFAIEAVPGGGYRLVRPFDDLLAAEAVLPFLLGQVEPGFAWLAGLPYRYAEVCESTNEALKSGADSLPSGAVVVAEGQTKGRGRLGRDWISQRGKDLTFSVLMRPSLAPAQAHLLSLSVALAVSEVLETIPGLQEQAGTVGIKWPNDVLLGEKKVCGILLEGSMDVDRLRWVVAGIGVNVNSDPTAVRGAGAEWLGRPSPTSLKVCLGHSVPRAPLLADLLVRLTKRWAELEATDLLQGIRERDVLTGRRVTVFTGPPENEPLVTGEALGIGPEGQLLVRTVAGTTVPVFAGDVTVQAMQAVE